MDKLLWEHKVILHTNRSTAFDTWCGSRGKLPWKMDRDAQQRIFKMILISDPKMYYNIYLLFFIVNKTINLEKV